MATALVLIEGKTVVVTVESGFAEFALKEDLDEYESATGPVESPWVRLVGFKNPMAALRQIGAEVMRLGAGQSLVFEGATGKRASAYARMLKRSAIDFSESQWAGQSVLVVNCPATAGN